MLSGGSRPGATLVHMSPSIIPASAPPARFSLDRHPHMDAPAVPVRRTSSRIRQAAAYVGLLVWGVPLAAFVVAAVHADATPCAAAEVPCNDQGVVVLTAVLAATLLIPVGLLAMLLVAVLAAAVPSKAPAVLAVLASASVAVVAGGVWGIVSVVTT